MKPNRPEELTGLQTFVIAVIVGVGVSGLLLSVGYVLAYLSGRFVE